MFESYARYGLSAFVPLLAGALIVVPFYWMPPWHVWLVLGVVWVTAVVLMSQLWMRFDYEEGVRREVRERAQRIDRPRQAPPAGGGEPAPAGESKQAEPAPWPPRDQSF